MLTYSELQKLETYEERLEYLKVGGVPAEHTFGAARPINQKFYNSPAWKRVRAQVIARDLGWDLGIPGKDILGKVIVHHMNPLTAQDLVYRPEDALNPEFLITVSNDTHLGIHFGFEPPELPSDRSPGDTKLW